jgi:hypothetical protein
MPAGWVLKAADNMYPDDKKDVLGISQSLTRRVNIGENNETRIP